MGLFIKDAPCVLVVVEAILLGGFFVQKVWSVRDFLGCSHIVLGVRL